MSHADALQECDRHLDAWTREQATAAQAGDEKKVARCEQSIFALSLLRRQIAA